MSRHLANRKRNWRPIFVSITHCFTSNLHRKSTVLWKSNRARTNVRFGSYADIATRPRRAHIAPNSGRWAAHARRYLAADL